MLLRPSLCRPFARSRVKLHCDASIKASHLRDSEACEVLATVWFERETLNATSLAEENKKHEFLFERAALKSVSRVLLSY